jgi:protein-L-isoaspartate(D-aspartate) O-methyltransferase
VTDLAAQRRFFAEEVQVCSNIRSAALVEALATVPREQFLPAGPWTVRGEADFAAAPRQTPDADPRHVYHNVAIALDPASQLFNGAPGLLAMAIDALDLRVGGRVLHIGAGTGYFTALMAHCVGRSGRVVAVEIDPGLADRAAASLSAMPWVEVHRGDASEPMTETFDAILVNAGVTHPLEGWLDCLSPVGRLVLPLTATMPAMTPIGKGLLLLVARTPDSSSFDVRLLTFIAIYSAIGLRDEAINTRIGQALARSPFPRIRRLRRDAHEPSAACWLHCDAFCLGSDQGLTPV